MTVLPWPRPVGRRRLCLCSHSGTGGVPSDGSALDLILPDGVTLLDYYGAPAEDAESLLHNEYSETSAAVLGVYVQADADLPHSWFTLRPMAAH